jgi:hypothetical protein
MKNLSNIKLKDNIIFGILFFVLFLIIGLYPLTSGGFIRIWSAFLSLVFLIITIIRPNLFTLLNKLWIQFGILLGKIISPIVMGLVFFFVVTPIGMLVRILRKDVMGLKRGAASYWINREDKEVKSMKKQF